MKVEFKKIPDYGDIQTLIEWTNNCKVGMFIDYDGWGYFATENEMSNKRVIPSDLRNPNFKIPKWVTHIIWFNK